MNIANFFLKKTVNWLDIGTELRTPSVAFLDFFLKASRMSPSQ